MVDLAENGEGSKQERAKAAIGEAPEYNSFYHDAFRDLANCRVSGMGGVGPIPFPAIVTYGSYFSLNGNALDDFVWVIMHVDRHYMNVIIPMVRERDTPKS